MKMRTRFGTILVAVAVALAVGGVAGWFVAGVWGGAHYDSIEDSVGRARLLGVTKGRACCPATADAADAAKPRRKVEARTEKRQEPVNEVANPEEKPVPEEKTEAQKETDNPFPRYLDMFKNNPEALAAEFQKEAEADNTRQRKLREGIIAEWKLNQEQAAMFERALDDLKAEVTRLNEEYVGLIKSGELNYEDDGSISTSNRLLAQRFVATREAAMRETSERLYDQLELDGVSDAEKQRWLFIATQRAVFSYECYEPYLAVYDKVYKNMGFGNGIFSWCKQQGKK